MGISVPCSQCHRGPNPLLFGPEPQSQEPQHLFLVRVMDAVVATAVPPAASAGHGQEVPWAVCKIPVNWGLIISCARLWHQRLMYYQADLDMSKSDVLINAC